MRVLVATDGSVNARAATQWLMVFPLPPTTQIVVLAAVPPMPPTFDVPVAQSVVDAALAEAREAADAAVAMLGKRWPEISARVVDGDPRQVIAATAADSAADLVVVGARGLGMFKRLLLGSVSTAVVHHAPCPVLVVRSRPRELLTAVVAIDGSSHSRAAARFLASLPLDPTLTVRLMGVIEPQTPSLRTPGVVPGVRTAIERFVEQQRRELDAVLQDVAVDFQAKAMVERDVRIGSPAAEILKAAEHADLVVVGARGVGALDRLFLGSVSERVLQHARCSVLVVKPSARG
jgi:nucleotide-binding universal stress UspA family protein